jgi:hypothetical protein
MLLQELEKRGTGTAPGETACAAMACRAAIGKQPCGRFALIEILGMRRNAAQRIKGAEHEQAAPQLWLRHELQLR